MSNNLNIASSRATEQNGTLREILEANAQHSVAECLRRLKAYERATTQLGISECEGLYFVQLCAGPFNSESEAYDLFDQLAQHRDEAMKHLASYQRRTIEVIEDDELPPA